MLVFLLETVALKHEDIKFNSHVNSAFYKEFCLVFGVVCLLFVYILFFSLFLLFSSSSFFLSLFSPSFCGILCVTCTCVGACVSFFYYQIFRVTLFFF